MAYDKPSEDFSTRLSAARRWRDTVKAEIEEVFKFCAPDRVSDFSTKALSATKPKEAETYDGLPEELATDLAGDLVTYFTPAEVKWAEYEVIQEIPKSIASQVEKIVTAREDQLFELIQSSNYNDIAPMWAFEAATHGTPALWVTASHLSRPLHFEVVPPHELLITPGHLGYLDRFRETRVPSSSLPALFASEITKGQVTLNNQDIQTKIKKPGAISMVVWGFWLDWADPVRPVWKSEITVDGKCVTTQPITLGPMEGACPLQVGRFNPRVGRPWGRGAGMKALRDIRVLDMVNEVTLSGMEQALTNTLIYADDGFLDLSEGLEAGRAYPAHRGFTRDQIYELNRGVNVDQGWFAADRFEMKLRAAFYQDGPRQRGETPPTAAQWLDERRRVQQRLGKPSAPIWSELILPMIQRVEFLGVAQGRLPEAISLDGEAIKVTPISPLQKAQNQDKVMVARSNLDMAFSVFQDQTGTFVDPVQTFRNIVRASGDELTVIRDEQQPMDPNVAPTPPM